jgi:hypothetical protein
MVIAEAAYLIDRQLGAKAEATLYASIIDGQLEGTDLGITDWQRIQDLVSIYADLRLGGTDASVIAVAERHGAVRIATLNRRHFTVVRPRTAAITLQADLPGTSDGTAAKLVTAAPNSGYLRAKRRQTGDARRVGLK